MGGNIYFSFDFGCDAIGNNEFLAPANKVVFVVENLRHFVLQWKTYLLFPFFYIFFLLHL